MFTYESLRKSGSTSVTDDPIVRWYLRNGDDTTLLVVYSNTITPVVKKDFLVFSNYNSTVVLCFKYKCFKLFKKITYIYNVHYKHMAQYKFNNSQNNCTKESSLIPLYC